VIFAEEVVKAPKRTEHLRAYMREYQRRRRSNPHGPAFTIKRRVPTAS